jgi:hypothetical protein
LHLSGGRDKIRATKEKSNLPYRKEKRTMNDQNKKVNPEETEKDEKTQVPEDEAEKVAAGANFWFWDRERRKPKG